MKIPSRVLINGSTWKVIFNPGMHRFGFEGFCFKKAKMIVIDSMLPKRAQWETFLHEAMHAMWDERKFKRNRKKYKGDLEESAIDMMDVRLLDFLVQNKIFKPE